MSERAPLTHDPHPAEHGPETAAVSAPRHGHAFAPAIAKPVASGAAAGEGVTVEKVGESVTEQEGHDQHTRSAIEIARDAFDTIRDTSFILNVGAMLGEGPDVENGRMWGVSGGVAIYIMVTLRDPETGWPSGDLVLNLGASGAVGPVGAGSGYNLSTDPEKDGHEMGAGGVCGITVKNPVTGPAVGCGFPFVGSVSIQAKGGIAVGKTLSPEGLVGKRLDFLLKPIRAKVKAALKDTRFKDMDVRISATLSIQNHHAEPYLAAGIEGAAAAADALVGGPNQFGRAASPTEQALATSPVVPWSDGGTKLDYGQGSHHR